MIRVFLFLCVLLLNSVVFADYATLMHPEGDDAIPLIKAVLHTFKCYSDGTCKTKMTDIYCLKGKNIEAHCRFNIQTFFGGQKERRFTGTQASNLIDTLFDKGAIGCGIENCGGTVRSVDCSFPITFWQKDQFKCSIESFSN